MLYRWDAVPGRRSRGKRHVDGERPHERRGCLGAGADRNAIEHLKQRAPLRFTSSGNQQRAILSTSLSSTSEIILAEPARHGISHRRKLAARQKAENNQLHLPQRAAIESAAMSVFRRLRTSLAAIGMLLLAACQTNAITGRSQFVGLVSESEAISGSAAAYQQMMGDLDKKKQIDRASERTRQIQVITDRLIAEAIKFRPDSAGWRWEVQVINDPKTVNAFCMAGGKMAIYSGMWEQLKATDDELAEVMGHEISHALADHTRERMSVARSTALGVEILGVATGVGSAGGQLMQTAAQMAIELPNSRESEAEADRIGIELAARAGYDPKAAVTLWEKMGKLGGGRTPEFLSTHPAPEHRAATLRELGVKVEPYYLAAKAHPGTPRRFVNVRTANN
ncbi:MAG TPA: M48 family metallopeptidase [Burkholderiales bacterium]|nr:M48 family metallopeptidase [Burkholderiales bacterium]